MGNLLRTVAEKIRRRCAYSEIFLLGWVVWWKSGGSLVDVWWMFGVMVLWKKGVVAVGYMVLALCVTARVAYCHNTITLKYDTISTVESKRRSD